MTETDPSARSTQLARDIREFIEDEDQYVAIGALGAVLGWLIFSKTGNKEQAAALAGCVAEHIAVAAVNFHEAHRNADKVVA